MATLSDLQKRFAKHPKTLAAIERAITQYGRNAEAVMTKGLPSTTSKNSNMVKAAQRAGFSKWTYFSGARAGKNANDGYYSVIVKVG